MTYNIFIRSNKLAHSLSHRTATVTSQNGIIIPSFLRFKKLNCDLIKVLYLVMRRGGARTQYCLSMNPVLYPWTTLKNCPNASMKWDFRCVLHNNSRMSASSFKCDTANNLLSTLILLYFVSSLDWPLDLDLATSTNGGLSFQLDL